MFARKQGVISGTTAAILHFSDSYYTKYHYNSGTIPEYVPQAYYSTPTKSWAESQLINKLEYCPQQCFCCVPNRSNHWYINKRIISSQMVGTSDHRRLAQTKVVHFRQFRDTFRFLQIFILSHRCRLHLTGFEGEPFVDGEPKRRFLDLLERVRLRFV